LPEERFREDALRMLRAVRFRCTLGFSIEDRTFDAMKKHSCLLSNIAAERIADELRKALMSGHPEKLSVIKDLSFFREYMNLNFRSIPEKSDPVLRAAHIIKEEDYAGILKKLKTSKKFSEDVIKVISARLPGEVNEYAIRKLVSDAGFDNAERILLLNRVNPDLLYKIRERGDCTSLQELHITGRDLIEEGIAAEGREIGEILHYLFEEVMEHPDYNKKSKLLELSHKFKG
jgi:tRNA nucleotidyltransferase (CCA-adding enzyme)